MHNFKQGNLPFARGNYNVNLFAPFKALSTGQWGKLKWKQKLQLPRPGVPTCRSPFCCLERNCPEKHFPVVLMAVAPAHLSFECDVEICRCHRCSIACLLSRALSDIRAIWAMNRTAEYHPTTTPGCWHQDCGSSEIKVGLFPELMWHADTHVSCSVHTWERPWPPASLSKHKSHHGTDIQAALCGCQEQNLDPNTRTVHAPNLRPSL